MKAVAWVLASIVLPLLITEFTELGPWLAERLVRRSARLLPPEHRDRYTDEWLAELDLVPGKVLKVVVAARLALRAPATRLAVQGLTFSQALQVALAGRLNRSAMRLADRASRLSSQPVSESSQRYIRVWLQRNITELQANLLRSTATACFTVGLSVQFIPVLRKLGRPGIKWYLRSVPKVQILEDNQVHIHFGGPKTATHKVAVSFTMTVDEDED